MSSDEPFEEAIEDLEAPAAAQSDVAGGVTKCVDGTCANSDVATFCSGGRGDSCHATKEECKLQTAAVVIHAM